jgi:hypothetical protein
MRTHLGMGAFAFAGLPLQEPVSQAVASRAPLTDVLMRGSTTP